MLGHVCAQTEVEIGKQWDDHASAVSVVCWFIAGLMASSFSKFSCFFSSFYAIIYGFVVSLSDWVEIH